MFSCCMSILARSTWEPLGELTRPHASEQVEALLDGAVTMRALDAGSAVSPTLRRDRVTVLIVDVGEPLGNQQFGPLVQLLEVVARVERLAVDRKPEPREVVDDRLDVARVLRVGVGVVESQVADPTELLGDAEVHGDRLGVTDVEIAVRLGREPRLDAATERATFVVGDHQLAHEVGSCGEVVGARHDCPTVWTTHAPEPSNDWRRAINGGRRSSRGT